MAESMSTGWFCMQGGATGQQVGPLTWEQVFGMRTSGSLQPQDLVWHPTMPQWMPAASIPGLFPEQPPAQPAAQAGAYQQTPAYQQAAQPAYTGQAAGYQPAPTRSRSNLWAWLAPLIAVVLIGIGVGVYFGFFYDKGLSVKGGDASIPVEDIYGLWQGTLTYESLDVNEDKLSADDAALLEKLVDEDVPLTIDLAGLGGKGTATVTMDFTAVDPGLQRLTEEMDFTYDDGKLTLDSGASGDKMAAAIDEKGGELTLDGKLRFEAGTHSGEAAWTATK